MRAGRMRYGWGWLLLPMAAQSGVVYDLSVRPVDQREITSAAPETTGTPTIVTEYFVDAGKLRIGGANAKSIYIFDDRTMYVIDNPSRTVHVLHHATLSQAVAHYADTVKRLEEAAASAPPEERAEAQRKAADMKQVSERLLAPVPRAYRITVRFESVDGHACRIWEERENGTKRLELCVAPASTVPGGAEILGGMKTLSQFRQGADFALGVDFGLSEWWSDIAGLGGVPLLIREFKFDTAVAEIMLTSKRQGVPRGSLLELPDGLKVQEGPEYADWYVR